MIAMRALIQNRDWWNGLLDGEVDGSLFDFSSSAQSSEPVATAISHLPSQPEEFLEALRSLLQSDRDDSDENDADENDADDADENDSDENDSDENDADETSESDSDESNEGSEIDAVFSMIQDFFGNHGETNPSEGPAHHANPGGFIGTVLDLLEQHLPKVSGDYLLPS
jgi:hypothetical protein